jgi:hypothetical protein
MLNHKDIHSYAWRLIRENCIGCVNGYLSQKDHPVCLDKNEIEYYFKIARQILNGPKTNRTIKARDTN